MTGPKFLLSKLRHQPLRIDDDTDVVLKSLLEEHVGQECLKEFLDFSRPRSTLKCRRLRVIFKTSDNRCGFAYRVTGCGTSIWCCGSNLTRALDGEIDMPLVGEIELVFFEAENKEAIEQIQSLRRFEDFLQVFKYHDP
jgi:hypothetical protein